MQRTGDKVGDYILQRLLGAGNFGEVWLAQSSKKILHRQVALKFAYPGKVKLADFGMSRLYQGGGTMIAGGTPTYMAPENFERKYSEASDVWAAGVLLYRLLTRRLPFEAPPPPG